MHSPKSQSGCIAGLALVSVVLWRGAAAESTVDSLRLDVPFDEHLHRQFLRDDGLTSNWINDIVQTRDGFVWIGTDNGLVRYDGVRFQRFDRSNERQLPFNEIHVLYEAPDGLLWIGTTAGLARYRSGRPGVFENIPGLSGKTVRAIFEDGGKTLWVGTEEETFARRQGEGFETQSDAPGNVRAVIQDRDGTLWFGANSGLYRCSDGTYERIAHERLPETTPPGAGIPQARVNALLLGDDGSLWIGANRALLHMRDGKFTPRGEELTSQQIYDILPTRNGGLYVAARFGLYRSVKSEPFELLSDEPSAFCLMEDRAGGLWVGYGDNRGLRCHRNKYARSVWNDSLVRCLFQDSAGAVWFGSNDGLHRLKNESVESFGREQGLPALGVQTIAAGAGGSLWIGTTKGLAKWSDTEAVPYAPAGLPPEINPGVILEDSKGGLWVAPASKGGWFLNDGELTELTALSGRRVHWFWEDASGTIWIGHESGLFRHREGRVQQVTDTALDALHRPRFLCHDADTDGTLWMGTSNGIARRRSGRLEVFAPGCGLGADNIERLAADGLGNLWYGGRDGLFHVPIAELDAFAAGRISRVAHRRVAGFERFPPLRAFSQGCLVRDGELWIIGEGGLMRIPIAPLLEVPQPPTAQIEQAVVDGVTVDFEHPFTFKAGRRRLSIRFTAPAFVDPDGVQIRYRLDSHDPNWALAENERIVHYTDLRPGNYRFRVSARYGNGPWHESDPGMNFAVVPRWWETLLFRAACTLVALALVTILGRQYNRSIRIRNITLRKEVQERKQAEEKARSYMKQLARINRAASMGEMATSIAHEVNQPLFAIVSNAQTAKRLLDRKEPDIDEIRDALDDIVGDGNRAAAIIDRVRARIRKGQHPTEELDLNQVTREAIQFVQPDIRQRGLSLRTEFADDLPPVKGNTIELQQVILNLIINGAQAMRETPPESRELLVRTSARDGFVELAVQDRGTGFDEELVNLLFEPFFTTKPNGTGMGLAINRTIIEAHGGRIWATQNDECGSTFCFQLPAATEDAG